MIPKRFRRILALSLAVTLALAATAGPVLTVAATPEVYLTVVASPPEATQGERVGFTITVDNQGNSNSAQSTVEATIPNGTTWASPGVYPTSTSCTADAEKVTCSLGNIPGHTAVTIAIVFQTDADTPTPVETTVTGYTTGTPGDPGGNSHGDQFIGSPANPSIGLVPTTNGDFSGRFVWDPTNLVVGNVQTVGSSNLQATRLTAPGIGIAASVKDGPNVPDLDVCGDGTSTPAPPDVCSSLFGQNSSIYVAGDATFAQAFPVTVTFSKFELPGGVNQNNIAIYHTWIDGNGDFQEETIEDRCTFDPPSSPTPDNAQCLTATKSSIGITVTVWLFHNGNIKGY